MNLRRLGLPRATGSIFLPLLTSAVALLPRATVRLVAPSSAAQHIDLFRYLRTIID